MPLGQLQAPLNSKLTKVILSLKLALRAVSVNEMY